MSLRKLVPADWQKVLKTELSAESFKDLSKFLSKEWKKETIFPPKEDVFSTFSLTPFEDVEVLILGQDPYHDHGQAHGLAFSVLPGIKIPPSLRNIYKEYESDLGLKAPKSGCLTEWAEQGVMMLNTVLTVRAHNANSHQKKGWEQFTDGVIREISERKKHVVFVLWGNSALKKLALIDEKKHTIITSAHPSPLSAHRGFFESKPFSKINDALKDHNQKPIDWTLKTEPSPQLEFGF